MVPRRALRPSTPRSATALRSSPGGRSPEAVLTNWADVLASLDDAVVVTDNAARVTFFNPAAESLTGASAGMVLGEPIAAVFPADEWLVTMIQQALDGGAERHRAEGTLAGATPIPVAITVSPILNTAGGTDGAAAVLHDLRYRKHLDDIARHADRAAALELLTAGLAHEIKNPLGAIRGAAQLLERAAGGTAGIGSAHTALIVREVDRLSRLLDELGALARPAPLELGTVNIHRVLHAVLDLARQSPDWRATVFQPRFDPSLPDVRGNEHKLVQVFLNVVINAVHAMGGAGVLALTTRMVTDYHVRSAPWGRARFLAVDIEDTGPGIGEVDSATLFAPYFTTKPGGSGLGLAVSQQIVSQHAGRITMRNRRPGPGTIATILLPMIVPARQP